MNINPWIITGILLVIVIAVMVFLYFKGSKLQKEQEQQRAKIMEAAQQVTMLVIDKKRLPLKNSGLPQMVLDQTPKRAQLSKVPIVKAKVGPRIMTLIADEDIYDLIPVKAEIRAMVSGIYITSINNFRKAPVPEPEKKGFAAKIRRKADAASQNLTAAKAEKEAAKTKKKK